jgi:hypothetical protein
MNVKQQWNDADMENEKDSEKNKSHIDCLGCEPGSKK